jgi:hypothetical protein
MSAAMERRYRAALDWYPKVWRDANGEAMLGTLLDEAEATGREWPRLAELTNLALFGLHARVRHVFAVVPAGVRDRASALALGAGAGFALVMFLGAEWAPWAPNGPRNGWASEWHVPVPGFGPFASAGSVFYALWILAAVAAAIGFARVASVVLAATIVYSVVLTAPTAYDRMTAMAPPEGTLLLLAVLAVIAMLGDPTRAPHHRRGVACMAAGAAAATAAVGAALVARFSMPTDWFPDAFIGRLDPRLYWMSPAVIALMALVLLAIVAAVGTRRSSEWSGAAAILAVPWFFAFLGGSGEWGGGAVGVLAALIAIPATLTIAVLALRWSGYRLVLQRSAG